LLEGSLKPAAAKCRTCSEGHPYLVAQDGPEPNFSLLCDIHLIACGSCFTEAFDFHFKFLWVFGLEYPCGLANFFLFIQCKVYEILGAQKVPPLVNEVSRLLGI
jgi:hypothetical protein